MTLSPGSKLGPKETVITATTESRSSIAILPFVNMGDDNELTETALAAFDHAVAVKILYPLNKIPSLRVANRVASRYWHNKGIQSIETGRKLGVENILECSIRSSGNHLNISAKLIKVSDGSILWSEHYSLDQAEFSAILNKILLAITKKLQVNLPRKFIFHYKAIKRVNKH